MDDGEIKIKTSIDTSGIDKGVKDVKNKLDDTGKAADSFSDKLKNMAGKGGALTAVFAAGVKTLKAYGKAIKDTAEAYKVQYKAETALETAALNNPYINDEAVDGLKRFASELQKTTDIGDEASIKLMAQLVATGRTQEEIQGIMLAASNLAADGSMTLESAVKNLNKTYSGLAGELGENIPALRTLTQEELKQGKAIDLISEKYGGLAENLADASVQAQNAKGDLAEAFGSLTIDTQNWLDLTAKGFYEKMTAVINWINTTISNITLGFNEREIRELLNTRYEKGDEELYSGASFLSDKQVDTWIKYYETRRKLNKEQAAALENLRLEKADRERIAAAEKRAAQAAAEKAAAEKEIVITQNRADELARANKAQLEQKLAAMQKEAELTGEEIDRQEVYNVVLQSYIDLITAEGGIIKENYPAALERLKMLEEEKVALDEIIEDEKTLDIIRQIDELGEGDKSKYDLQKEELESLEKLRQDFIDRRIKDADLEKEELKKIDEEIAQNKRETNEMIAGDIKNYVAQIQDITQQATDLALKNSQYETEIELAELEKKRKDGVISEKEYEKEKREIQQKSAQDEYKIQMASWTASLLMATANIAEGVTKAIALGFPQGIAAGALLAAAGGVQIASIIASKPVPPKFATGGIVGGNSYTGDNVVARVNSGEMILNAQQQRALWDVANGASSAAPNITINNSASNIVSARPQINRDQIAILIDARVNESLRNGVYDTSLAMAQQGANGEFLGI